MLLQFEVHDADSGAFAYADAIHRSLLEEFSDLVDRYQNGRIGAKTFLAALAHMLATAPDFIDAHYQIALHWHEQGKPKKALDAALLGLSVANGHVPHGFGGRIEWADLDNRSYLRTMNIALQSYMRLRRHRDAVQIIDQMLARNPNDNQGVRFLLGSEALRAGDYDRACSVLEAECGAYPPYCYELALCFVLRGQWAAAATALRRGFAVNPYIAELLCGNADPVPLAIWHESNFAEPEVGHDYIQVSGQLWLGQPEALAFTRWLFNQSKVLAERAAIMECREALLWETDFNLRAQLLEQVSKLTAAIDGRISESIVTQRKDRHGRLVWPWAGA